MTTVAPKTVALYDLSLPELEKLVTNLGEPAFRARQVWHWLYKRLATSVEEMTDLPKEFRHRLAAEAGLGLPELVREQTAEDGLTHKVLLRLHDGQQIETVLMRYPESGDSQGRATVCVSTQAGCAVGCPFCATGRMGLLRNLSPGEIVGQVIFFARRCQVTNVVFMGMGEPLLNYDNTWRAIETLNHPRGFGLGARRMTISTSGIVPGIQRLAGEKLQVNLAISLHAPNDRLRNILVPVNRKYPIAALMQACKDYVEKTGRRVSYEYVLLAGVNDTPKLAHELGALLRGTLSHVNLIPLNPTASAFTRPRHESVLAFQRVVRTYGIATTVRIERGVEISAACGQLTVAGPAAT